MGTIGPKRPRDPMWSRICVAEADGGEGVCIPLSMSQAFHLGQVTETVGHMLGNEILFSSLYKEERKKGAPGTC